MATFLHFAPAVALAVAVGPRAVGWRLTLLGVLCAVMPDADFLLVWLRLDSYSGTYGHRGFTHSLGFALAAGLVAASWPRPLSRTWRRRGVAGLYLALCTASHPLLDGLLDAGICNAWLWPVDGARHCMAWRPIPLRGVALFGWARLGTEALWIGGPLVLLATGGLALRAFFFQWPVSGTEGARTPSRAAAHREGQRPPGVRDSVAHVPHPETERRRQRRQRMQAMQGLALAWQTGRSGPLRGAAWGK